MRKILWFLSILVVILSFGAVGCDLLDTDLNTDGETNPNCKAVCEIIIDDCGVTSETGLPGENVSECIEGCVDSYYGDDMDSDEREDYEDLSCDELEISVAENNGDSYPNCQAACVVIIDDCELGSISGPPGSTVAECAESCVENYGYADMPEEDIADLNNMTTCDEVEEWINE